MKLFNQDGIEMMDVSNIALEGDRIVIRGKMMGTMATRIYVDPAEAWAAFRLFPAGLILRMPWLLVKGFLAKKQAAKAS